jgi:hypothetical protein
MLGLRLLSVTDTENAITADLIAELLREQHRRRGAIMAEQWGYQLAEQRKRPAQSRGIRGRSGTRRARRGLSIARRLPHMHLTWLYAAVVVVVGGPWFQQYEPRAVHHRSRD